MLDLTQSQKIKASDHWPYVQLPVGISNPGADAYAGV